MKKQTKTDANTRIKQEKEKKEVNKVTGEMTEDQLDDVAGGRSFYESSRFNR